MHGSIPSTFFSKEESQAIEEAITEAEKNTSGEIRVHLVRSFKKGEVPLEAGKRIFERLGMTKTEARNGVLFLLELKHQHFVILGDRGINELVEENFWESIKEKVLSQFRKGEFAQGLVKGILHCGEKLKEFFPYHEEDRNELPNGLSY